MGKNSGGSGTGGGGGGEFTPSQREAINKMLKKVKDPYMRKEMKDAIDKYQEEFGVRTTDITFKNMNAAGVTYTTADGKYPSIELNKNLHKDVTQAAMQEGWGNWSQTEHPGAHPVIHEMSHATWQSHYKSANAVKAGKEIDKVYQTYMKKGNGSLGKYASTNKDEFYAEAMTKHVLGKADSYTKAVARITKKYRL